MLAPCISDTCLLRDTPAVGVSPLSSKSMAESILGVTEAGKSYKLGKGKVTRGNVAAAKALLDREYPEITASTPFAPIFVPSAFIKKKPEVAKKYDEMTEVQRKHYARHKSLITGDESEQAAFTNFARLFREERYEAERIVVFHGLEFIFPSEDFTRQLTGEYDQIFVVEKRRLILYLENKTTFSRNHALKKRQFEKFRELLDIQFPVGEGWKLVTAYASNGGG